MKILITGGAGFQGSHLVDRCVEAGHEVTILSTHSTEAQRNISSSVQDSAVIWGSISDPELVEKSTRDHEVVIHLAARINVDESIHAPHDYLLTNVIGTFNVLEGVRKHGCRLIYGSSCEVYGSPASPGPINENADLRPHSPYAASKASADRLCFAYWKTYGIDVTIARPCNIYGPRQKGGIGGAVIPIFVERALGNQPLVVYGSGSQRRQYMHVDDLVSAYMLVLEKPSLAGEVFNFGTDDNPSIKEIAEFVARQCDSTVEYGQPRPGEVQAFVLDNTKAYQLGFAPKVGFWDGLTRYIDWRRGNS